MSLFRMALESANNHYNVYVVELSKDVLKENKFIKRNPYYDIKSHKPCVYVGMTGLDPVKRYEKHKNGIKSNVYVERYGVKLLPDLYKNYKDLEYDDAVKGEIDLAEHLRSKGFAVWQA